MKTKMTRLPDQLAEDVEKIAVAYMTSESRVLALAAERLVAEVKETGRLPLQDPFPEPAAAGSTGEAA